MINGPGLAKDIGRTKNLVLVGITSFIIFLAVILYLVTMTAVMVHVIILVTFGMLLCAAVAYTQQHTLGVIVHQYVCTDFLATKNKLAAIIITKISHSFKRYKKYINLQEEEI